jgi:cytoskeletal protein CcmA (bactofilin family)
MSDESAPIRTTVVEQGTRIEGSVFSSCPVVVLGTVDGNVNGPSVEVADGGAINGKVVAKALRSWGQLAGHFEAEDMELAGRVMDQTVIRARALQISVGKGLPGMVFGACEVEVGEAPDKVRAVSDKRGQSTKNAAAAAEAFEEPVEVPVEEPVAAPVSEIKEPAKEPAKEATRRQGSGRAQTSSESAD